MKPAALPDLPMHAGRRCIVSLHAIDPEVVFTRRGALCIDERQCHKMTAVLMPELKQRELLEIRLSLTNLQHRRLFNLSGPEL